MHLINENKDVLELGRIQILADTHGQAPGRVVGWPTGAFELDLGTERGMQPGGQIRDEILLVFHVQVAE